MITADEADDGGPHNVKVEFLSLPVTKQLVQGDPAVEGGAFASPPLEAAAAVLCGGEEARSSYGTKKHRDKPVLMILFEKDDPKAAEYGIWEVSMTARRVGSTVPASGRGCFPPIIPKGGGEEDGGGGDDDDDDVCLRSHSTMAVRKVVRTCLGSRSDQHRSVRSWGSLLLLLLLPPSFSCG
jgi:hypothetical protein